MGRFQRLRHPLPTLCGILEVHLLEAALCFWETITSCHSAIYSMLVLELAPAVRSEGGRLR